MENSLMQITDEFLNLAHSRDNTLHEYSMGQVKQFNRKYVQRLGSPGNYKYIYSNSTMNKMTRKVRWAYTRLTNRARVFINKFATRYDAVHFGVKQQTWHKAVIDVQDRQGSIFQFKVNLAAHGIYSYRSKRTAGTSTSSKLSSAKKRGILRSR